MAFGPACKEGGEAEVTWVAHLDWPTEIADRQRGYIARRTAVLGKTLAQRVLDEWHGATKAGVVRKPWPYFNELLRKAAAAGEAWVTHYAHHVAQARAAERQRLAHQVAAEASFGRRIGGRLGPLPPGALAQLQRETAAAALTRRAGGIPA
ncbi:hypothetical protein OR16_04357 [Cupriavidus basilensis OR16]|uniref:Uncharacterized protein n=1 Tax=Cupriavidus basilensis OR16 TaxID=1127483 RepID=H1RZW5_9BURK|nr:hypothetical protein OR16_04357 [Cupriavidus basilensis OR16]